MVACWEYTPSVLVGTLHTEVVPLAWALGLRNLMFNGAILPVAGMPYDMARNTICMKALEGGFDFCLHLDSDVIPQRDAVLRLMKHNLPLVSGVYHRRSPPHGIPVMIRNGSWVTEYPANSLIEVDYVGAGCLLLRRDFLENFPPIRPGRHWFSWQVDQAQSVPPGYNLSEDFVMCRWAKEKMGVPTIIDTGVQCRHVGYSEYTFNHVQPLNCTPIT